MISINELRDISLLQKMTKKAESPTASSGNTEYAGLYQSYINSKKIVIEQVVVFGLTEDRESKEVFIMMEENGLKAYCEDVANTVLVNGALEFLYNLRLNKRGYLATEVRGQKVELSDKNISECLHLPCTSNGILPEDYKEGREKAILKDLLQHVDSDNVINLKKGMLKRKYRLLLDIIHNVICGITFSKDDVTNQKIRILAAIIDRAHNINWVQIFKNIMLEQSKSFVKDKANKRIDLKRVVSLIMKITFLIKDA